MSDAFQDPKVFGGVWPAKPELLGRLVAFVVKGHNPNATITIGGKVSPAPEVEVDIFVIDGGPLEFGGKYPINGDAHTPPNQVIDTPCVFKDVRYSGVNFVSALKDAIGGGPVVGVVERSTFGQHPYNITKLESGHPRRTLAAQFWGTLMTGGFANPEPKPIPGRGAPTPGANPYAQPEAVAPPGFEAIWGTMTDAQKAVILGQQPAAPAQPQQQAQARPLY